MNMGITLYHCNTSFNKFHTTARKGKEPLQCTRQQTNHYMFNCAPNEKNMMEKNGHLRGHFHFYIL